MDDHIRKTDKAISFVVVDARVGVACLEFDVPRFVPLNISEFRFTKMGLHYFRFEREVTGSPYEELDVHQIEEVGVMLPQVQLMDYKQAQFVRSSYTLVDRSHRHLDQEATRFSRNGS